MFAVVLRIGKRLWVSLWNSPLLLRAADPIADEDAGDHDGPAEDVVPDAMSDAPPVTVKAANKQYQAGRNASRGSLDYVCKVFSKRDNWRVVKGMVTTEDAFYQQFGERSQADHTQWGSVLNCVAWSTGHSWKVVAGISKRLSRRFVWQHRHGANGCHLYQP